MKTCICHLLFSPQFKVRFIWASVIIVCIFIGIFEYRNLSVLKFTQTFLNNSRVILDTQSNARVILDTQTNIAMVKTENGPWGSIPSFELNIRLASFEPKWFWVYQRWFLKGLKLFWPKELYNLTVVLNSEAPGDHTLGKEISLTWPFPRVVYIEKPNASFIGDTIWSERFRMYYDAFFPELYTKAEFIGFVDTDTIFITPVTPQSLFEGDKPIVVAIAGQVLYAKCTEFILKEKQLMMCMSYYPVTMKVTHLIAMRAYIEKLHGKSFGEVFYEASFVVGGGNDGCVCQFAIMCNYVYRFHRNEYIFRIQMYPDNNFANNFNESEKIPFIRIAIHAKHVFPGKMLDTMEKDSVHFFNERIKESLCIALGFEWCPNIYCNEFTKGALQRFLFAFEKHDWSWDNRCLEEQRKHYLNVKNLFEYQIKNKIKLLDMFENQVSSCMFF